MRNRISRMGPYPRTPRVSRRGFSLIEVLVVVLLIAVVTGIAVPKFLTLLHQVRLQGAASDFAGLLQQARMRAVQDDNYYSTYFNGSGNSRLAFVDVSKNGGTSVTTSDPVISIPGEVVPTSASSAPDTSNLKGQFLPTGSTLPVSDGTLSTSPVVFNSRGLPCSSITTTGGNICSSSSTYVTAFWIFFQDNITSTWEGVTVSPAGRIEKWRHDGSSWSKM